MRLGLQLENTIKAGLQICTICLHSDRRLNTIGSLACSKVTKTFETTLDKCISQK